ncbi:M56 family metallopeptidase [Phocaeicola vulgatus]|uniref:M56 family metallopeptidase n=1 Tax=Phocaeicola vulgatus TaxID=821 RepID=UPI00325D6073
MITTAPELIYMLKVNIGIALFYAFYKLFCCRDTFFQWRRIALLSFLALSFLYPLMDMQAWVKEQPAINELADYYALMMLTETNTSTATVVTAPVAIPTPDLLDIIKFVYWIGILLLSARFMIQLSSIFRLVLKSKSINVDQISIRSLSEPANPFSFWQWIFIYLPGLKEDEKQEILTHEQTHVRQWHSIDVIISEIVNIICWMNPFAWLLKTEIRLNLEYLADHKVMESGTNKKAYQYHLLGLANQNRQTGLYNNFNLSHLKNRIKMMNKKRTRTTGHIKYALFAPLTAALLLVSNIETVARTAERLIYSTEESTPRPEREEVASFVNTTVQGLVTFTITVTNSEGKPQPNITLQIKPGNEVKTFKTNAEGKATIEVDMTTPKYVSLDVSSPKSSKHQSLLLSANKPNVTAIFDTDDDIAAYIKAGKQIRIKLQISNNDNQQLAGVELISSSTNAKATTNAHGEAQLTVGVGETIAINHKGYQEGKFTVKELYPIKDMENPELVRLLLVGEDPVYQIADNMPEFPGGMIACLQYLARNIKYPVTAQKEGAQGKVIVQMVIEKDGSVDHVSIVRSITPELDAEAARVVKSMPKWKPATVKDKAVRCRYTVPVTFKLQ